MIFRFAHPAALLFFLVPIVLYMLYRRGWWRPRQTTIRYSDVRLVEGLSTQWRARLHWLPDVLRWAGWALLVIGLARPQSGRTQDVLRGQGIDIVLALDISGSMAALDFEPQNRLEAAKSVISNFIDGREFDRIGLVVFAQDAFQIVPPTLDYPVLLRSLTNIQLAPALNLEDGTAIGLGIASAGNMLRQSQAASKVVILLTDGVNNSGGVGPVTAAQAVAALGMRVYTIGMGKLGLVPMPDGSGGTQLVESEIDEATLQTVADTSNGRFFRAEDLADLQSVYDQINSLERSDVERQIYVRWQDQSFFLLWIAAILLIGERVARQTVFQTVP